MGEHRVLPHSTGSSSQNPVVNHDGAEREKKRAVLWDIINTGDNNDKCRAMDILNKMDSEYVNVNINDNRNAPDLSKLDLTALKDLV